MKWKGYQRKQLWPNFGYYLNICLEGLRKTTRNLSQDSRSPCQDLNPGPPEYEAGVLTTWQKMIGLGNIKRQYL
jgi:hypothetical protein